ncbi:MAG: hypothetical protein ACI9QL_002829 [Candidatus Omnitrophota bacterium]|jgi:hypothetical protein
MLLHTRHAFLILIHLLISTTPAAEVVETDICIYGGTSGGVAAAVQARRMGKRVVLLEPGRHLGGLTSGGLGKTDTGNAGSIGGISSEFYTEIGQDYGTGRSFTFEPHVAEARYETWIERNNIPVYREQLLAAVRMNGKRITEIEMRNGNIFRARVFIDTTYEGDLMAGAGVSYAVGREANSAYGETINGIRASTPSHQFNTNTDPYIIPGDPTSGLLRYIEPGPLGTPGSNDDSVQAYNYRLCLTQTVSNQLPITAPPAYTPFDFELLRRYIDARIAVGSPLSLGNILKIDAMPNGKTDINNQGAFSTDYIGEVDAFPDGDFELRAQIISNYQHYVQGFLYFLGNDPQVPTSIRDAMQTWGLCRDEFVDNGGWNHQLYVREARRMISDYVMTQANCQSARTAPKSIGLGSYTMDSHNCRRIVDANGFAHNEGDVQIGVPQPYEIGFDAITPSTNECDNLLVTFCLSASHVAFGSCRMEPVFMITSQSAATAAAFAIDDNLAIQDVDYAKLRYQLLADGQILDWGPSGQAQNGTIVDNSDPEATLTGAWTSSSASPGYYGNNYVHDGNVDQGSKRARFIPNLPQSGDYQVYLNWAPNANRASNVPVTITYDGGTFQATVDQRTGGGFELLGTFPFLAGTAGDLLIETTGADGYVIADAASWVSATNIPRWSVGLIASDPWATEGDANDPATFLFTRTDPPIGGSTNLTVHFTVSGSSSSEDVFALPTSVTIPANVSSVRLDVLALLDDLFETNETITLTLDADLSYDLDPAQQASVTLMDRPFDIWRRITFSVLQLADALISSPDADPDADGMANLFEFMEAFDPLVSDGPSSLVLRSATTNRFIEMRLQEAAETLPTQLQVSGDLSGWRPSNRAYTITRNSPWLYRSYPVDAVSPRAYYRQAASLDPFFSGPAQAFFSFDTDLSGTGGFDPNVTVQTPNVPVLPSWTQLATMTGTSGGANAYTDFDGTTWLGSGNAGAPGHCIAWQPGSTGNVFQLHFSTIGLEHISIRFDIRSAQQVGGSAPTAFNSFTYDLGAGPQSVPGADLSLLADNTFHEWSFDLSSLGDINGRHLATLAWAFNDLGNVPAESFRIDNVLITGLPVP